MDKLEAESRIIEIGQDIITLREMIATNQQRLAEQQSALVGLLAELEVDEVKDALEEVRVVRQVTTKISFNSKAFKKAHPKKYENYRIPSKTFKQKKLKTDEPELYNEFTTEEEVVLISVERYIDEESLPTL